jgi:DNA invertase Pin-like site-specific DNA recombinase
MDILFKHIFRVAPLSYITFCGNVNPMNTAIYVRQSIEKRDSLSLDAQEQSCIKICDSHNWSYQTFRDSGFSGKNTKRPAFKQLMQEIEAGNINRVVCYRFDRISRSMADLVNLVLKFDKLRVEFVSITEQIDTSTPMGKAMVYMSGIFAQLERDTIRERIRDSWFYRAKNGIFTGGHFPFGYQSERKIIDGKEQSVLKINYENSKHVELIFDLYVKDNLSLKAVAKKLNSMGIPTQKNKTWTSSSVKIILSNAIYAPSTSAIYKYFDDKNCIIISTLNEFDGNHGIFVGNTRTGSGKDTVINPFTERFLIVGRHKPIVSSEIWLAARYRLDNNVNTGRAGTGRRSWLGGLIKCAKCGRTMEVTRNGAGTYYARCSGRTQGGNAVCTNAKCHRIQTLEQVIEKEMLEYIEQIDISSAVSQPSNENNADELKLIEIDKKITNLLTAAEEDATLSAPVTRRINELEKQRNEILNNITPPQSTANIPALKKIKENINKTWGNNDNVDKNRIAKVIINNILLDDGDDITITYNM